MSVVDDLLAQQHEHVRAMQKKARVFSTKIVARAAADAQRRVAAIPGGDLGTWGAASEQAVMRQLDLALDQLNDKGSESLLLLCSGSGRVGWQDTATFLRTFDRMSGAVRPLRFDHALWMSQQEPFLINRFQRSFQRYGAAASDAIRERLAGSLLVGEAWPDAAKKIAHLMPEEMRGKRWMVERTARTEMANAYNGTAHAALVAEDRPDDRMMKRLVATFDSRTAPDSRVLHGQTVPVKEPFVDVTGRLYMYPPNRPHDREVIVGWRKSYEPFMGSFVDETAPDETPEQRANRLAKAQELEKTRKKAMREEKAKKAAERKRKAAEKAQAEALRKAKAEAAAKKAQAQAEAAKKAQAQARAQERNRKAKARKEAAAAAKKAQAEAAKKIRRATPKPTAPTPKPTAAPKKPRAKKPRTGRGEVFEVQEAPRSYELSDVAIHPQRWSTIDPEIREAFVSEVAHLNAELKYGGKLRSVRSTTSNPKANASMSSLMEMSINPRNMRNGAIQYTTSRSAVVLGRTPWSAVGHLQLEVSTKKARLAAKLRFTARHEYGHAVHFRVIERAQAGDVEAQKILRLWKAGVKKVDAKTRHIRDRFGRETIAPDEGWGMVSSYAATKPEIEGLAETFALASYGRWDRIPKELHEPLRLMLAKKPA